LLLGAKIIIIIIGLIGLHVPDSTGVQCADQPMTVMLLKYKDKIGLQTMDKKHKHILIYHERSGYGSCMIYKIRMFSVYV